MEWLNLHAKTLDSPEVIGADPTERGTWLMLLRFCIGQENAGRIADCRDWKDRKWQQLLRVTRKEVEAESDLWTWEGDALVVTFYPCDKEEEIRMKRDLARTNGKTGGRPKKNQSPTLEKTNVGTEEKPTSDISAKAERKGKEVEGNRERESTGESSIAELAWRIVETYPRREKTASALVIVETHLLEGDSFEAMLAGTKAAAAVIRTLPSGAMNRYVPGAESFFLAKRWADDPETLRRQGDPGKGQMNMDEALTQLGGRAQYAEQ